MCLTAYVFGDILTAMFEVTVTDEFARWFESLDEPAAIQVASALEIVEAKGPTLGPDRVSNMLLFYDGTAAADPSGSLSLLTEQYGALMLQHREAIRCLASGVFQNRLAQLDESTAHQALRAVDKVKSTISAARALLVLQFACPRESTAYFRAASEREKTVLRFHWARGMRYGVEAEVDAGAARDASCDTGSVKEELARVVRLLGLEMDDLADSSSGLRELTINATKPRLRVIYGIDVPRKQIVVLLGEALARSYYGDSVRLAEQRWNEYTAQASAHAETR
jgi:hypothetical protein